MAGRTVWVGSERERAGSGSRERAGLAGRRRGEACRIGQARMGRDWLVGSERPDDGAAAGWVVGSGQGWDVVGWVVGTGRVRCGARWAEWSGQDRSGAEVDGRSGKGRGWPRSGGSWPGMGRRYGPDRLGMGSRGGWARRVLAWVVGEIIRCGLGCHGRSFRTGSRPGTDYRDGPSAAAACRGAPVRRCLDRPEPARLRPRLGHFGGVGLPPSSPGRA